MPRKGCMQSDAEGGAPVAVRPCCRRRAGGGGALVEPAALAALLAAGGCGYDMRRAIVERTGGAIDVDVGGLYRSLRRLEEDGAVVSHWSEGEVGPRRREYELTEQGLALAEQWVEALRRRQRVSELLAGMLEEGLRDARDGGVRGEARAPETPGHLS